MLTDTRDPEDFSRDKPKDESPAVVFTPIYCIKKKKKKPSFHSQVTNRNPRDM